MGGQQEKVTIQEIPGEKRGNQSVSQGFRTAQCAMSLVLRDE